MTSSFVYAQDAPPELGLTGQESLHHWLVAGQLRRWEGEMCEVFSPVMERHDGQLRPRRIGHFPALTSVEAHQALESALSAYDDGCGDWATRSLIERLQCLERLIDLLEEKADLLSGLLMWEIGKSLRECRMECDRTLRDLRKLHMAAQERDLQASRLVTDEGVFAQIRRAPLGVVLCLGPYNFPLNETFVMLLPALLAGNSVILKLPRRASLWFGPLLPALAELFPPGVLSVLFGATEALIPPLMKTGRVAGLGFVGPSQVATALKAAHPKPHRLRTVLGLEAKNAAIILADADLDCAVRESVKGALAFNGQRCTALKILFVHRSIETAFVRHVVKAFEQLSVGMPWEEDVQVTPLPTMDKVADLDRLVEDAKAKGAGVNMVGSAMAEGTLYPPVLVGPVEPTMRLWREEQFGPVVPYAVFDTTEEIIAYLATADTGQQASLFGEDPATLGALIDPLVNQVGRVNINCKCQRNPDTFPFVGRKDSGEGPLSIPAALDAFSLPSLVASTDENSNRSLIEDVIEGGHSRFLRR